MSASIYDLYYGCFATDCKNRDGKKCNGYVGCPNYVKKPKLALLNTSILTTEGNYTLEDITLEQAQQLITDNTNNLDSAIGHQSTAEIMTTLLGVNIPVNRQMFKQEVGQQALVFKLNVRSEEGKILTADEIEAIGYKFQLLVRNN